MTDLTDAVIREEERWKIDQSDSAAWDARALVDQLSKGGHGESAVDFGERAVAQWPSFEPLAGVLAWAYYRRDIGNLEADDTTSEQRQTARNALARIKTLLANDPYGRYSAWPTAVLQLSKVAATRWPRAALDLLYELEPSKLNTDSSSDYTSPAGRWHLGITKALEDLEDWDELLRRCDEALTRGPLRHEDTKWVKRRRALALEHLGRPAEAAVILKELRPELNEWWLEGDLARALSASGAEGEAVEACQRALSKPGDLTARWRTVFLLGQLLEGADAGSARDHYQLARHLRVKRGWPVDRELEARAQCLGISGDPPTSLDYSNLRRTWRAAPDSSSVSGVVKVVLEGGKSGFITPESGEDIYFAMPRNESAPAPEEGTHVTFRVVDSFDRKKNRASQRAVDVRPVEGA